MVYVCEDTICHPSSCKLQFEITIQQQMKALTKLDGPTANWSYNLDKRAVPMLESIAIHIIDCHPSNEFGNDACANSQRNSTWALFEMLLDDTTATVVKIRWAKTRINEEGGTKNLQTISQNETVRWSNSTWKFFVHELICKDFVHQSICYVNMTTAARVMLSSFEQLDFSSQYRAPVALTTSH